MIRALASLGIVDYIATFENIDKAANADKRINKRIHKAARQASVICNFHSGLNSVMTSRESHIEGGDPMASMLINLIKSDDRLYRDFAMDRVHREKIRDSRIFDVLEAQVVDYLERSPVKELDWKDVFMRRNIQALGLSGDAKYKGTVQRVLASQVDAGAKKYAQVALSRLQ